MSLTSRLKGAREAGAILAVGLMVVTGCMANNTANDELVPALDLAVVKVEVTNLGHNIQMWYAYNDEVPRVTLRDGVFEVGDPSSPDLHYEAWSTSLDGAVLTTRIVSWVDWCVTVSNSTGTAAASYSHDRGLEEGATCGQAIDR